MAKSKKSTPAAMPMDVKQNPMMHLDGEHAKALLKSRVGDKVRMEVHGKVTSMSQHQYDGEKPRHSVGIELHTVKHKKPQSKKIGHVGGKHADAADGAKDAMDSALRE